MQEREVGMQVQQRHDKPRGAIRAARWAAALVAASLLWSVPAGAQSSTIAMHGALHAAGGGPVSDGDYKLTFSLWDAEKSGKELWSESATLKIAKGQFWHVLGSVKALSDAALSVKGGAWLAIAVASDPALPRRRMHSVAYARQAAVAHGLACSGCVPVSALNFDGDVDLKGKALKAGDVTATKVNATDVTTTNVKASTVTAANFNGGAVKATKVTTDEVAAKTVVAGAFVGDGSKLTGISIPSGQCKKAGEVVKGINPDGTLKCIAAMDPSALPADGLNEVSNDLLSNQFVDEIVGGEKLPILDNNPTGKSDDLDFPDIGIAQKFEVIIDLTNSDVSKVALNLFSPDNTKYELYKGGKTGKALKGTWPTVDKTVSGDLGAWVGKNPKGKWRLQFIDSGYLNNKDDGEIVRWSIKIQTLSNKKVAANGVLVANGGVQFHAADKPPIPCDAAHVGFAYYNSKAKSLMICNGKEYDLAVKAALGTESKPAPSCLAILNAGDSKGNGLYWIDPDGLGGTVQPFQGYCDMTTDGGGWLLVFNLDTNDGAMRSFGDTTFWKGTGKNYGSATTALKDDYKSANAYEGSKVSEILIWAHAEGARYNNKDIWARYKLNGHAGKTFHQLLTLGNNTTIATRTAGAGNIAKNAYNRNAGDVFIDHGLPMIVNSTGHGGTDADNTVRIGTEFKTLCGVVNCNGHNVQGGYGGYHHRNGSYPLEYEAMPNFGYHPGPMGFGDNFKNNAGCGQSVWSNKCNPENAKLQVDFALFVR